MLGLSLGVQKSQGDWQGHKVDVADVRIDLELVEGEFAEGPVQISSSLSVK